MAVRLIVADDHPIWRSGLRADLGENFFVVGEAGDADEAIDLIGRTECDLVVCDLNMPNGGGIKVAKECGESVPIVILRYLRIRRVPNQRTRIRRSRSSWSHCSAGGPGCGAWWRAWPA